MYIFQQALRVRTVAGAISFELMRCLAARGALFGCLGLFAYAADPVRVWQDSVRLPTYAEHEADPLPQFAAFNPEGAANYPYPLRNGVSPLLKDRSVATWRTLNLENEYLFCRVLPDLGGHLYNCRDKIAGREVFYANPVIKKYGIGLRGAWIATGIELNFPMGHSRVAVSPVNFATRNEVDGAASVIVGDTDRVTGMHWRVEYRLRPGIAVLEQRVTLYNPTPVRHAYYWWNNAGVEWDDPGIRYIFPTKLVAQHDNRELDTWPVNTAGKDASAVDNAVKQVAWFAYLCREPFMGIYKPKSRSGVVHFADPFTVAGKMLRIIGKEELAGFRKEITDDFNMYVEMQAGLFGNQETYAFLAPEQSRTFTEYWIPFRNLSGLTRATPDAVLYAARDKTGGAFAIEVGAMRAIAGAHIRVSDGKTMAETTADLDPKTPWSGTLKAMSAQPHTIQVLDGAGHVLLEHIEGVYNAEVPAGTHLGPQPQPNWNGPETEMLLLNRGEHNESIGQMAYARTDYELGMSKFPQDLAFEKKAGRLDLTLLRFDEAAAHFEHVLARSPADDEAIYYAGVARAEAALAGIAQAGLGHDTEAVALFSKVSGGSEFAAPAAIELAMAAARGRDYAKALKLLAPLAADAGRAARIDGMEAALMRASGDKAGAAQLVRRSREQFPEDAMLRYESALAGVDDPSLWSYLAGDAERVLNLASEYLRLGLVEDALGSLSRDYSRFDPILVEPGAVEPHTSALIAYYRAYCKLALVSRAAGDSAKLDPSGDLRLGSSLGTRYVFPNRAISYAVLRAAIERNPKDATAHALLGNLEAYSFRTDAAMADWEKAVSLNPALEVERKTLAQAVALMTKASPSRKSTDAAVSAVSVSSSNSGSKSAPLSSNSAPKSVTNPAPEIKVDPRPAPKMPAAGTSAVELANSAMLTSVSDATAAAVFKNPAFANDKQPDEVRRAYIEVQLQDVLRLSEAGKCDGLEARLDRLGDEDRSIEFTLYGFGHFTSMAHFQYYLGVAEATCNHAKEARKYWGKAAKMKEPASSIDFAYPAMAARKLDPEGGKAAVAQALKSVEVTSSDPNHVAWLTYALLLHASGDGSAIAMLAKIARDSKDPMAQYLATVELAQRPPR